MIALMRKFVTKYQCFPNLDLHMLVAMPIKMSTVFGLQTWIYETPNSKFKKINIGIYWMIMIIKFEQIDLLSFVLKKPIIFNSIKYMIVNVTKLALVSPKNTLSARQIVWKKFGLWPLVTFCFHLRYSPFPKEKLVELRTPDK